MIVKEEIEKALQDFLQEENIVANFDLRQPEKSKYGDYATNLALISFNQVKEKYSTPLEWAKALATKLSSHFTGLRVESVAPGFINFHLSQKRLQQFLVDFDQFDWHPGQGKTVVIDYSAPNVAKPFGIGHLRSTVIGQALYNLYEFLGYEVIGDNHIGDWGTQFGQLIFQIKDKKLDSKRLTIEELEKLYVEFNQRAEEEPELEGEARSYFKRLEEGDKEIRQIWQNLVDLSLKEYEKIYQLLGVEIDYVLGESFYQDRMPAIVKLAKKKKLLKESRGAQVIEIPGMSAPAMLIKSDGATTYLLRDLATIAYRVERWQPEKIIYEVGADHKFHFRQVFQVADKLDLIDQKKLIHVPHGMLRSSQGEFSTRKGNTIHLEKVLEEAVERAENLALKAGISKDLDKREQHEVAKAVGIGAVKYNDLRQNPTTNIVFDWDKALALEGNSGPYLQYTYARMYRLLQKGEKAHLFELQQKSKELPNYQPVKQELALIRSACHFAETVQNAAQNFAPNLLAEFLFNLTRQFNAYYQNYRIIEADEKEQSRFRLQLVDLLRQELGKGLELLGLERLEKM